MDSSTSKHTDDRKLRTVAVVVEARDIESAELVAVRAASHRRRVLAVLAGVVVGAALSASAITVPLLLETRANPAGSKELRYHWSDWGPWSADNVTCAHGVKLRVRNCTASIAKNAGNDCAGSAQERRNYRLANCQDCLDLYRSAKIRENGLYTVNPDGLGVFTVYCDMTSDGGGWTVFQRRQDGSIDFNLHWNQFKTGFGNLSGEFWLGNDNIHRLARASTLRVKLEDWGGVQKFAKYGHFRVGDEASGYELSVSHFIGSAGNSLAVHNGMRFSTRDHDNDRLVEGSCAVDMRAGWWFRDCHDTNLNGNYLGNTVNMKGVVWRAFNGSFLSLKFTEMKTRRAL